MVQGPTFTLQPQGYHCILVLIMLPHFLSLANVLTRAYINTCFETVRIQVVVMSKFLCISLLIKEKEKCSQNKKISAKQFSFS